MTAPPSRHVAVVGGGPAGLMAAETARAAGCGVDLYDAMGSVGRKFLIAGKGGLNLTHSEPLPAFLRRFGDRADWVGEWLRDFGPEQLRGWAREFGVETMVGTSGRVFPLDLKAAPLLRGWVRRLREQGVRFHVHHRWLGWSDAGDARFATPEGERHVRADATILALGGASWPELGSDGGWSAAFAAHGLPIAPLRPANCGFEADWSEVFATRHAGAPVKPVRASFVAADGVRHEQQGEFIVTAHGVEGSLLYALAAPLRDTIVASGAATLQLDLAPDRDAARLQRELAQPRGKRTVSEHVRRHAGLSPVKIGLLHECLPRPMTADPSALAAAIKSLPLRLLRTRPIAEAISSAGGVPREALDEQLMLRARPGVFCAGEMLDWEAPTGGYLLTASFASGRAAAQGALDWLARADAAQQDVPSTTPRSSPGASRPAAMQCSYFAAGRCRSCSEIATPYDAQLAAKVTRCRAALAAHAAVDWLPPVASAEVGFRNKAKMVVAGTAEAPTLGILDPAGQGVDLVDCPLYPPALAAAFAPLARFITLARIAPYDVAARHGELKYLLLTLAEHSGELMLRFVLRSQEPLARIRKHLPALQAELPQLAVASVNLQPEHKAILEGAQEILLSARDRLSMRLNGIPLHLKPQSFFQTNDAVAARLYAQAREWVDAIDPPALWDLFCGVGGFALHCADGRREVTGIELSAEAIASAELSRVELGLSNVAFRALDATDFAVGQSRVPPLVIVNPPRRGIGVPLARFLDASPACHVVYSSCNADSLARDLAAMPSFRLQRAGVFDMFPHTTHYEVLALLERA